MNSGILSQAVKFSLDIFQVLSSASSDFYGFISGNIVHLISTLVK